MIGLEIWINIGFLQYDLKQYEEAIQSLKHSVEVSPDDLEGYIGLGEIYVRHFRALQRDVHDMLAGIDRDWDADELVAIQRRLTANAQRMIPAVDRVLNYVHQRTVQRLTLEAVRTAQETGTGIGGVKVDRAD